MTDALRLDNVTSGYGPVTVLRNVTMRVGQGEILAILGSNGAGKSTLLKTVVGLLRAKGGSVWCGEEQISLLPTESITRSGVVLIPEGRQLFPSMTVLENLQLGAFLRRRDRDAVRAQFDHVYELFPILRERSSQLAGSLSGGQQQMVAIGRGLMARPSVLLLDEPSLGLAPVVLGQVFGALRQLRDRSVTIVLVEQNAMMTLELADRAYVLERGQVSIEGTAAQLLEDSRVRDAYLGLGVGSLN